MRITDYSRTIVVCTAVWILTVNSAIGAPWLVYDDFDTGTVPDPTRWQNASLDITQTAGVLRLPSSFGLTPFLSIEMKRNPGDLEAVRIRARLTGDCSEGGFTGAVSGPVAWDSAAPIAGAPVRSGMALDIENTDVSKQGTRAWYADPLNDTGANERVHLSTTDVWTGILNDWVDMRWLFPVAGKASFKTDGNGDFKVKLDHNDATALPNTFEGVITLAYQAWVISAYSPNASACAFEVDKVWIKERTEP